MNRSPFARPAASPADPLPPGGGGSGKRGTSAGKKAHAVPSVRPPLPTAAPPPSPARGEGRKLPAAILAASLLSPAVLFSGCAPEAPAPTIAQPVAPVVPTAIEAETLPTVKFVDITEEAGITFVHQNYARGEKLLPETMGGGVAFFDYDGDGDQDLFLVNSAPWPGQDASQLPPAYPALYRNDGKGRFEDVTEAAGLKVMLPGMGVAIGDYDNDGDPDLYLTTLGGGHLYRNDGGKFLDVTAETNTRAADGWLTSAAFFDMENDGDLDLFVCNYVQWTPEIDRSVSTQLTGTGKGLAYDPPTAFKGTVNILLRNDGGTFTDITSDSGIECRTPDLKEPMAKSLGVAPYDIDGDGLVDLAVANDTVPNFLFHNQGGGRFEEIGMVAGVALDQAGQARGAMGIDWADFRGDGSLGLAIGNFANEMTALYVTDAPQSLQFSDLANLYGLGAPTQPPLKFGLFFFDYDLDGRPDLLSANGHLESDIAQVQASQTYPQAAQLFWNSGKPGRTMFQLVSAQSAGPDLFRPIVGRGSAYADIDGDGDLDVVLTANGGPARLFRNDGGNAHHWLRINLKGSKANRDAIGAKVAVTTGDRTQSAQNFPARGYLSSVERVLTFGLGSSARADKVVVTWPGGDTTELTSPGVDRVLTIEQPGP
jgi:hypothetical protein